MCALIIQIQSVFRFYISKITSFVCLCQSASLVCDSNPVVASQTRFAVHRMERRICANLNLTYSQSMEHGLSPDMFFKYIGGVFPAEIRPSMFPSVVCTIEPCLRDGRFMSISAKRRICAMLNIEYS